MQGDKKHEEGLACFKYRNIMDKLIMSLNMPRTGPNGLVWWLMLGGAASDNLI